MKILKISAVLLLLGTSLVSCGGEKASSNVGTSNSETPKQEEKETENKSDTSSISIDLSSPSKAVESFIRASQAQDSEGLSKCFSTNCEKEFQMIVKKEMKEKDLKEFKEFCLDAQVLDEKIEGNIAMVTVKFSKRDEEIKLELVDDSWKIVAF
jgi:hypothetical protein